MNVSEKLEKLQKKIDKIKEKFCYNCQEFDCDFCPFEYDMKRLYNDKTEN